MMDKILIITGPTGVGKTRCSLDIAKEFNGEIISCDSFQIYKYLNIGTDKIRAEDMDGVVHHNLDFVDPAEDYNSSLFKERTKDLIKDIKSRNKLPILVGGTGLYIHSIIYGLDFSGGKPNYELRKKLNDEIEENGLEYLYKQLIEIDENIKDLVDKNNKHRIIRAFEIYENTGDLPSKHLESFRNQKAAYDFLYIIINQDRQKLYENINSRVDQMFDQGLVHEIENLLKEGYNFDLKSFKAIGYKEFKDYFCGESSLDEVKEKIKQHSRNYAKRQLTWFRRVEEAKWMDKSFYKSEEEFYKDITKEIGEFLKKWIRLKNI